MRTLSLLLLLLPCAVNSQTLISTALMCDLDARYGVQTSNALPLFSYITNWVDNHTNANNDGIWNNATNNDLSSTFLSTLDYFGNPVVYSPHGLNGDTGFQMVIPTNTLVGNLTNSTIYMVATPSVQHDLTLLGKWQSSSIKIVEMGEVPNVTYQYPIRYTTQVHPSTNILCPVNTSVISMSFGANQMIFGLNHYLETNTAFGNSLVMGFELGGKPSTIYYGGFYYRILIYTNFHNASQLHQNISYLTQTHNVVTNFTRLVVCRGDSITEGYYCTNQQSWPYQLYERNPDVLVYNAGVVSARISTNGVAGSGNVFYSNDFWFVDTYITTNFCAGSDNPSKYIFVKGGVNDIFTDSITGQITEQRLTNYCAQRPTSAKIIVGTIANASRSPAENTNFNAAVRANKDGWWYGVSDGGCGSPIEQRLNDTSDRNYFAADGLHLQNGGAAVICDHFQQFVNLPRRQTGFW